MKILIAVLTLVFVTQHVFAEQKALTLECGSAGVALGLSVKAASCHSAENPSELYSVGFLGFGLSAGGEGGQLQLICKVNSNADFPGYYVGGTLYGYAGKADSKNDYIRASFYGANDSSCDLIPMGYGLIADAGSLAILNVTRVK